MPIYEYECKKCGHRFEKIERTNSSERKVCPVCKGKAKRVLPSGVAFVFKGSGFYATDYAKKKPKPDDEGTSGKKEKKLKAKEG
ncbi:zinc ribbon domain-containing protein [candidate division TA06 bacterium]|uniref:Zinc ribbon domain-containing protein n=1 Tax=candidate division TA06 bacterium TaxID=2250710 RepID=A0A523XS65_UNCT6|nr:MAG: zinc ribbon domain-containing protein [candidate division TA06 bacterium]